MSWTPSPVVMSPLSGIVRVVADSDLDGLMAAAVLKAAKPSLEVHFAHPALIRAGSVDHLIDRGTAICDLPFHPDCGLYLDHHLTNRPTPEEEVEFVNAGGICHWRDTPSAARAAFDLLREQVDLGHLDEVMPMVDDLDSGGISLNTFLEDGPILRLARSLSLREPEHMQTVLDQFSSGMPIEEILEHHSERLDEMISERNKQKEVITNAIRIEDGMAICDLGDTGVRTNGYLVTAIAGEQALACCVIHGYSDGSIEDPNRPALGASFYANSFRSVENQYDLSRLATLLDDTGGGHANACGCRIQKRNQDAQELNSEDKLWNLKQWMNLWSRRDIDMLR